MRFYGRKSGRNRPGALFARSYFYYSRQKHKGNSDHEVEPNENVYQGERQEITQGIIAVWMGIAALVSLILSVMACEGSDSLFVILIVAMIFYIPALIAVAVIAVIAFMLLSPIIIAIGKLFEKTNVKVKISPEIAGVLLILFLVLGAFVYNGIDNHHKDMIEQAIASGEYDRADDLNSKYYFHMNKGVEGNKTWLSYNSRIDAARKASYSAVDKLKNYPDDYLDVTIEYGTCYSGGAWDYGVTIENDSEYCVTLTELTISSSSTMSNDRKTVTCNIRVPAKSSINTVLKAGEGQRKNEAFTTVGNVNGGHAYMCTRFKFDVAE